LRLRLDPGVGIGKIKLDMTSRARPARPVGGRVAPTNIPRLR
jgi:hypothetical protein